MSARRRVLPLGVLLLVVGAACAPFAVAPSAPAPTSTTAPTTPPSEPATPAPAGDVPAPASAGKRWVATFGEEFSGTALDTSKLSPCFDWNYGSCTGSFNGGREWYAPSQIRVSDGTAKLVAEPGSSPQSDGAACLGGGCTYRSGLLSTARPQAWNGSDYLYQFTYGYVEARMKLPTTQGFFTALWMLPADPSYVYRSEIDIVEVLGYDPSTMYMNYHYNNRSQAFTPNQGTGNNGACAVADRTGDWVRFGLDWQPTHIAWYIDGVKCGQFNGDSSTIESGPMQLIANHMVDHQWERNWGHALADTTLTRQLEIDYLRVYQQQ
ncbi:MAG TPA: glycoside hydrolase family 16 protein [Acidimicrobiia bacterium]|nr:glycoside hydrolase family 16 protein [Acidimicrobiia bacterium]